MASYDIAEAKDHFSQLLERVENGEEILLTRRGRPIARFVPEKSPSTKRSLGWAKDDIRLLPGWNDPLSEEDLLGL